ncbi:Ca-activated chloride channel family protein [Granulicella rosea]|uniref:Ca-activated chloride channel family protein n=1 Tax=Granulicella rosea TaxID=474952 RepID=A0A239KVE5_9BACT|nr:VIT domain-containing protein [Granulicella rosea]SNT21479.1 Ca-activated chloride channel family protein [Granulicella rosea]
MRRLLLLLMLACAGRLYADAGVLIPRDKQAPDPAILSLDEMSVEVLIDNGDARVRIVQIFANHTNRIEEGTYQFALPTGATVSDFGVWDGPTRIPAVILERKRAQEVYERARMQAIDPGLLQMGESDDSDPTRTAIFTAKIVPIPAYGTKRLELEYHQRVTATDFKQAFVLPLKPDAGQQQKARRFKLLVQLQSAHGIEGFHFNGNLYPLNVTKNEANNVAGLFEAENVSFDEDFNLTWSLPKSGADRLELLTHRDPAPPQPQADEHAPVRAAAPEPDFFEAQMLVGAAAAATPAAGASHTRIVLFDNSISMQWEKLERSYAALEAVLHGLRPEDHFNLLLFNQDVTSFKPRPIPASAENVRQALDFVRASKLRGGTDLAKAFAAGLAQSTEENGSLVLLTDGGSDRGESIVTAKIAARCNQLWKQSAHHPGVDIFAVGDDANLPLLRILARNDGVLESVNSTEPADFKLQSFLSKMTHSPLAGVKLRTTGGTSLVYALDESVYPGSFAQWVGQYQPGGKLLEAEVAGSRDGVAFTAKASAALPAVNAEHPQLPRLWAQARVDALLDQIAREGESTAAIDEIIKLSRRYKFVTPYTSFLAAPRSLLRPRVIRPGDPVLRVRTDPAITSVIALFPFGLTKPLRRLPSEDSQDRNAKAGDDPANHLWETRFLAPPEMKDGTYSVRLILRDTHGNTYREAKTFVIASTPPTVKLQLSTSRLHRGQTLTIKAAASQSTRTLTAHLEGLNPMPLHWSNAAAASVGELTIPRDMAIGRYTLTVTAEDIAHNLGTQEVVVDVLP